MKKLILTLLSLTTICFASEGAADQLASSILFALGGFFIIAIIVGAACVICSICEFIVKFWEKTNTFGKIVCFVLPGTAITGTIFYFLIWIAAPYIIDLVSEWPIVSISITGGIYYISTITSGWTTESEKMQKRKGKYAIFSRIFVSIPILPIILCCWTIKNLFGLLFLKDYKVTNILNFWKIPKDELSVMEERIKFFNSGYSK